MRIEKISNLLTVSLLLLVFTIFAESIFAHKVTAVSVVSKFDTKGRTYSVELAMDIYPSEDPAMNDKVSPQQAADFFSNEALVLFFGDTQVKPQAKSELFKDPDADPEIEEERVKVLVTLSGKIPEDAGHFTLRVSPDTTAAVVMVTFKDGKPGRRAEVLYPGEFSSPVNVAAGIEADPFEKAAGDEAESKLAERATVVDEGKTPGVEKADEEVPKPKTPDSESLAGSSEPGQSSMRDFIEIGFRSFFSKPRYEAALLALCFFFFSRAGRDLFFQWAMFVVVFTLALGIAVFGVVSISGMTWASEVLLSWVIPLGIVVLALENLFAEKLRWWRLAIVALLALTMGAVYSMTLGLAGISASSVGEAFAGFNLGFQVAQLSTLAAAALLVVPFRQRDWYRKSVALPASVLVAGVALYWIIEQTFFGG